MSGSACMKMVLGGRDSNREVTQTHTSNPLHSCYKDMNDEKIAVYVVNEQEVCC